ncbi:hypothetical protein NKH02_03550 [Mesorhizobium sp. M1396]
MAAKVEGDEAKAFRQPALILFLPAQVILRPSMDEEDGWSVELAPFSHMQLHAASADHSMDLHLGSSFA